MSNDDGLFREIDEDVRREQLTQMWDKYGFLIMGAMAAIILGVSGYKLSNYWAKQGAEEAAGRLYKAESLVEEKKMKDGLKLYKQLAASGPAGYAAISKLRVGSLEAAEGKTENAIAKFKSISENSSVDALFSDFATIQTAMLSLDKGIDASTLSKLKTISTGRSSWRHNAREVLALNLYKDKKYKEAEAAYAKILADSKSPTSLRKRADMMNRMISNTLADAEASKTPATAVPADKKKK